MLAALLLTTEQLARPWVVAGSSMAPALEPGDRVVVDLWTYRHRRPRAGEIALFRGPEPSGATMVKRVAPGPRFPHDRPRRERWPVEDRSEGPGIWMLGDNRTVSVDSRAFGALPPNRLSGRVVLRYWPPSRAGRVR
jgi:signal peptidase I